MRPRLVVPVGTLAIAEVMGHRGGLADVVGTSHRLVFEGHRADVIPLPHPSGASTWHRMEPGKTLLARALSCSPRTRRCGGPSGLPGKGEGGSAESPMGTSTLEQLAAHQDGAPAIPESVAAGAGCGEGMCGGRGRGERRQGPKLIARQRRDLFSQRCDPAGVHLEQ